MFIVYLSVYSLFFFFLIIVQMIYAILRMWYLLQISLICSFHCECRQGFDLQNDSKTCSGMYC